MFINDLAYSCTKGAELFWYADDAKWFKRILNDTDVSIIQADILDLQAWLDKFLILKQVLNLPTFKYRCLRGDMILVYNIISGVHDIYSSLQFNMSNVSNTRGNQFKMQLTHIHYNL